MTEQSVEEVLAEAALAAGDKPKKERQPKGEVPAGSNEPKKERKPKLDADGNPVVRKPKEPKLDVDGNPVAPKARNAVRDDQTLHITDKGVEAKIGRAHV